MPVELLAEPRSELAHVRTNSNAANAFNVATMPVPNCSRDFVALVVYARCHSRMLSPARMLSTVFERNFCLLSCLIHSEHKERPAHSPG